MKKRVKRVVRQALTALICCVLILSSCATNQTFTLKTDEPEADIYIDDEYVGTGSAVYTAEESEVEVSIEHEDYRPFSRRIEAESVRPPHTPEGAHLKSANRFGAFATAFGVGGVFLSLFLLGSTAGNIMMALSGASTIMGLPSALATGIPKDRWDFEYDFDLSSYSLYDSAGYHKRTGFNEYGVNRSGEFKDGSSFTGRIVRGKKEGYGTYSTADGAVYVGTFRDDELHGYAYKKDNEGRWLFGSWTAGEPDGSVVEVASDGSAIFGQWIMGNRMIGQPYGTKVLSPAGDWLFLSPRFAGDLTAHGYGHAMSTDGRALIEGGLFHEGDLVMGSLQAADSTIYEGLFSGGELARGTIIRPDGSEYSGDMKRNVPHGYGKLVQSDGTLYEGEFSEGRFEGMGLIVKANGESYRGSFKNGEPHGEGIYKFGEQVEKCEYYEGKRIDAIYLARVERQKQEEERRRREEAKRKAEEERRRKEAARQRRLAEQRRKAQEEAARRARTKALFKGLTAVAGAAVIASTDIVPDDAKADVAAGFVEDVIEEDYTLSKTREAADQATARRQSSTGSSYSSTATSSFSGTQGWSGGSGTGGSYTARGSGGGSESAYSTGSSSGTGSFSASDTTSGGGSSYTQSNIEVKQLHFDELTTVTIMVPPFMGGEPVPTKVIVKAEYAEQIKTYEDYQEYQEKMRKEEARKSKGPGKAVQH